MPILIETKITNSAVINARILAGKIFKLKEDKKRLNKVI